jgi:uncharacterized protein
VRRYKEQLVFSASDLVTFLGCRHATFLDRRQLDAPVEVAEDDAFLKLLQEKGLEHERALKDHYLKEGRHLVEIPGEGSIEVRTERTLEAMRAGAEVIYQGAFWSGRWHGYADFLLRVAGDSALGPFHYEPLDTKLAHGAKPKHVIQLGVYAELLAHVQGRAPEHIHVLLGTDETVTVALREFQYYLDSARRRFESFVDNLPAQSTGEPCQACALCRWRERCEGEWEAADHLSLVARITGAQIEKLNEAGVRTVAQLAQLAAAAKVPGVSLEVLARLRSQANLQNAKRRTGESRYEILTLDARKGFERLPQPDAGDLFFDMEGDPLFGGGLEYLFGFAYRDGGAVAFQPFWGHTRVEEKVAFEAAMDFIGARLKASPNAHIYHYAHHEETAIKRLAMVHGTREVEVDELLRAGKLVDLYRVVRESVRVTEPGYSLKNLEVFYREAREGAVSTASESVVQYELWRKLQDPALLQAIEDYNRIDCESTLQLRDWLLSLSPDGIPWHGDRPPDPDELERTARREAAEAETAARGARLLQGPEVERPFRQLLAHLLEFHKREDKPDWWSYFTRAQMMTEELLEDSECIGALERDTSIAPFREKQSTVHSFRFPDQDFKMRVGDSPHRAEPDRRPAGTIFALDERSQTLQLKCGRTIEPLGDFLSLMPAPPLDTKDLRAAVSRYADVVVSGEQRYLALTALLKRQLPAISGVKAGDPVLATKEGLLAQSIRVIGGLGSSYLLIQGPPGAGKTYLSARAILTLIEAGKRVAISANSHKAINRLLMEVVALAASQGVQLSAVKKYTKDEDRCDHPGVVNVKGPKDVHTTFQLVGGTAWLFCLPPFDQAFDYLFVDEAGQVSLGHLVAMGVCARNLVLVGDQMQLGQPIQGTHPGESGLSALEFLLKDYATIPPERGIFLDITYRLHPDVCRFISDAVYEGRLHADTACGSRRLVLAAGADSAIKPTGISWVPVDHQECTQRSEEEGARIAVLYQSLLAQRWIEHAGNARPVTVNDILVVSPYNMQVNLLQSLLPASARVGTVDKFQGQQAAVVIVSMTASSAEDVPRGMDFLYSRNRLNVAVSRAKSLAIIVASPRLLEASCSRIEQMALVNTLCHAQAYAADGPVATAGVRFGTSVARMRQGIV